VTADHIAEFESRHNVLLPQDFRTYFHTVNGMGTAGGTDIDPRGLRRFFLGSGNAGSDTTVDDDWFSFWRFEDVVCVAEDLPDRIAQFPDANRYFMFADHSIGLPTFAIKLSPNPTLPTPIASVFADQRELFGEDVYDSFTDFVQHYLDDPMDAAILPSNIPDPPTWFDRVASFGRRLFSRNIWDATVR
jgi:hypothetical protein